VQGAVALGALHVVVRLLNLKRSKNGFIFLERALQ